MRYPKDSRAWAKNESILTVSDGADGLCDHVYVQQACEGWILISGSTWGGGVQSPDQLGRGCSRLLVEERCEPGAHESRAGLVVKRDTVDGPHFTPIKGTASLLAEAMWSGAEVSG